VAKHKLTEEQQDRPDGLTVFESKLLNLLALQLVQERKQTDQIGLLNRAGFRPSEIALLLGTTSHTVSVELSKQKKAKKRT
jgi:NOL1/NOP2/fmu family ribosome biogenesis protein